MRSQFNIHKTNTTHAHNTQHEHAHCAIYKNRRTRDLNKQQAIYGVNGHMGGSAGSGNDGFNIDLLKKLTLESPGL